MSKQQDLNKQLPLMGVTQWRQHFYNINPVNVWNIEENANHGACTGQIVLDVNPHAFVYWGSINLTTEGDKILSLSISDPLTKRDLGMEEFIKKYKIDIITSSKVGYNPCKEWQEYIRYLAKKYNLVICQCAGNEGEARDKDKDTTNAKFPTEISHVVGALNLIKYKGQPEVIERANYSSVGEDIDFSQLVLWYSGTSASTPALAGQISMLMQRYGHMSQQETHQYLKMICTDLEGPGHDRYTGWGMPVLPDWNKKYITMKTTTNEYFIDGESYTMDTKPVNNQGRIMVPIRVISEALGAKVYWRMNDNKSITVIIDKGANRITLTTGSDIAYVNGLKTYLDVAPYIDKNNRTLVPIRFIAEALNCYVDWIQKEKKVQILEK